MTILVNIGRRIPKSWMRRTAEKVKGVLSFQEHIWTIVKQSLTMAKKKANADGRITFTMTYEEESEDLNYKIQWIRIVIQGNQENELEEYNEALQLYTPLSKKLAKEIPKDESLSKRLKSKIMSQAKIDEAYEKGFGAVSDKSISSKLLEMGVMTHVEKIDDYETRENIPMIDFN